VTKESLSFVRDVLTTDLMTFRWTGTRVGGTKKHPEPQTLNTEFHVNPIAIGLTALGAVAAMWIIGIKAARPPDYDGLKAQLTSDENSLAGAMTSGPGPAPLRYPGETDFQYFEQFQYWQDSVNTWQAHLADLRARVAADKKALGTGWILVDRPALKLPFSPS
jgi:hypothetical protein